MTQLPLPLETTMILPATPIEQITEDDGYVYRGNRPGPTNGEVVHKFVWVCEHDDEDEPLLASAEVIASSRKSAEALLDQDDVGEQLYYALRQYELYPGQFFPGIPIVNLRLREPWW